MAKDGKSLERLVGLIETALGKEGVKVESRKRLRDRTNGKLREHDVLVTVNRGHHTLSIAIECRDRSKPVTVDQVEAFQKKCEDTGIQQGAIVSASGFANSARTKAAHYGMRCLDVLEASSFDWMLTPTFTFITRRIDAQRWLFFPEQEGLVEKHNMEVLLPDGKQVPSHALNTTAQEALKEWVEAHQEPVEKRTIALRIGTPGMTLRNRDTGATTPIRYAGLELTYSLLHEDVPLRLSQYIENDKQITDVAVADGPPGRLAIVYKGSEGGSVVFQPLPRHK